MVFLDCISTYSAHQPILELTWLAEKLAKAIRITDFRCLQGVQES